MLLDYYKAKLNIDEMPDFLYPYLNLWIIQRLKNITYLCGMDYASKDIYDFKEEITRYDHSLTTALMTWMLTHNKVITISSLFHDASTPAFSHTIDYMNKDYIKQESTEDKLSYLLYNDAELNNLLYKDNINISDIINFKKYSIVDNERPKLCVDRLDGIILSGISWTGEVNENVVDLLLGSLEVYNHNGEIEIGFNNFMAAVLATGINDNINKLCHSKEDIYMMELMASIIKTCIERKYISYDSLYILNEKCILAILDNIKDADIKDKLNKFYNIKKNDIPNFTLPKIKKRVINPLVNNERIK